MPVQAISISFRQPDRGRIDPRAWAELDAAQREPHFDATVAWSDDPGSSPDEQDLAIAESDEKDTVPAAP